MRKRLTPILCLLLAAALPAAGEQVPVVQMTTERLPDLNTPRSGCVVALGRGGEPMVFGGHTTGFVPTQTAEYYAGGAWHELPMLYPHDYAFCLPLRSGEVLVGGGAAEAFGIGQSWGVEVYNPDRHTFTGSPILDRKRALASATELEDGTVVVSGNWYAEDAVDVWRPGGVFEAAGGVSEHRGRPFILPTGPSNAIIFGGVDNYGQVSRTGWVDRLNGEPFQEPLLAEWAPVTMVEDGSGAQTCAIGEYTYLLLGMNADGQYAVILVRGEEFSLLPLAADIPLTEQDATIQYAGAVYADRERRRAWVWGGAAQLCFMLCIDYGAALDGGRAPLTLYCVEKPASVWSFPACTVLPDGSLLGIGGITGDNYRPIAEVWRYLPAGCKPWTETEPGNRRARLLGLLVGLIVGGLFVVAGVSLGRRRFRKKAVATDQDAPSMMARITALMEEEQLFRRPGLTLQDVAQALGTNTRYVSACINDGTGKSFPDYINGYRVRYAQELLKANPGRPLSGVAEEAGFSGESSFFRNFKALTGKTPNQWLMER